MPDDINIEKYLDIIKQSRVIQPEQADTSRDRPVPPGRFIIDPTCDVRGIERMRFGKGVVIQKDCWLNIAFNNPSPEPMIVIEEGTNIGRRCTISAANRIYIGKFVLMAPNVFIADTHHEYREPGIPVMHQGITTHDSRVTICDDSWIGINTVIMGNVRIGRHCVIGANSVVNKDIPDYCVAVGNPVKVVKTYDSKTGRWIKTGDGTDLDEYPAPHDEHLSKDTTNAP